MAKKDIKMNIIKENLINIDTKRMKYGGLELSKNNIKLGEITQVASKCWYLYYKPVTGSGKHFSTSMEFVNWFNQINNEQS